jgi:hypothetical protein
MLPRTRRLCARSMRLLTQSWPHVPSRFGEIVFVE